MKVVADDELVTVAVESGSGFWEEKQRIGLELFEKGRRRKTKPRL